MVSLRRGKKDEAPAPTPAPAQAEAGESSVAVAVDDTPPAAPVQAQTWEPPAPSPGNGGSRPPAPGMGGLLGRMFGDVGEQSAAERDRQADMEFRQVLAPAMELLHASVPEASSPEEAARILEQSQGELIPDPQGGAYIRGDAYDNDARVYYRLLRRDYEKTPRPSEKRQTSHHLHQLHGKLTGNKGW